ncbi:MAG: phosphate ABC transporter substrate-binding protein [Candidatus Eremiobacteraeota bacterium]|nr:phosphate ABC transporter substrate-binding protein [Candidatus Eremiobacteraeota bacterium]
MKRATFNATAAALALGAVAAGKSAEAAEQSAEDLKKSLQAQADRARLIRDRGLKPHYTTKFDLSGLPRYQPERLESGWLRIHGSNYLTEGALADYWVAGFAKYQPMIRLSFYTPTSAAAFAALYYDQADLIMDHAALFYDMLAYQRIKNGNPVQVSAATGSYDVPGWQNSLCIMANEKVPLKGITLKQLDGIFGAERNGGWSGTNFRPDWARSANENVRTWDQLGLGGQWAGKRINPYGFSIRYATATEFSDRFLRGSDKWNERIVGFANLVTPDGKLYLEQDQMTDALAKDVYGIAYNRFRGDKPGVKRIPVAKDEHGPFVEHTIETVQNRSYPMFSEVFFYANAKPNKSGGMVREFLRYVLSQEGQTEVQRDGKYLPLTAAIVKDQLPKLAQL